MNPAGSLPLPMAKLGLRFFWLSISTNPMIAWMKRQIEADERIYQMMFTHYVSVTLLNEENNQFIQDRLRGILERVRQSNSFIKTTDKPRRFFSDEGKFRSDKFVCRMSDGSLKELEIATREEFDKLNDGFKAFLAKLSTP
jgi:hypothetical protein